MFIMSGDFIGHEIAIEPEDPDQPDLYVLLKET